MKRLVLLLAGGVFAAAAHAQSGGTQFELLPMPNTLPLVFFAPDSLAGPDLEPFSLPESGGPLELVEDAPAIDEAADATAAVVVSEAPPAMDAVALVQVQADQELPEESPAAGSDAEVAVEAPADDAAIPDATPMSTVHIIVENVETARGRVNVAVCDTGLSEEGCPYHTSVPAAVGFVEAVIEEVPPGIYAVVSYHDVNGNDRFDRFLAMPREPYALSGAAADVLVPEFSDATLDINEGENYVIIRLKRLGGG